MDCDIIIQDCKKRFSLGELNSNQNHASIPICILDAVFSIGVTYTSTINTVRRYCNYFHLPLTRGPELPALAEQHTVSELLDNINNVGIEFFTESILRNRQRTSSRNGILKSQAVYEWAKVLKSHGIEVLQDIPSLGLDTIVEDKLLCIPGQRSGISLKYFYMLCGIEDLCKPDRHLLKYLSERLCRDIGMEEAQKIMAETVMEINKSFPNVTIRLLDYTIWGYMSAR